MMLESLMTRAFPSLEKEQLRAPFVSSGVVSHSKRSGGSQIRFSIFIYESEPHEFQVIQATYGSACSTHQ